jgi:hypothetical protein
VFAQRSIHKAVQKGEAFPVMHHHLSRWRHTGVTIANNYVRCLYFASVGFVLVYLSALAGLSISCASGAMSTFTLPGETHPECFMYISDYCFLKAGLMAFLVLLLSPFVKLAALNSNHVPSSDDEDAGSQLTDLDTDLSGLPSIAMDGVVVHVETEDDTAAAGSYQPPSPVAQAAPDAELDATSAHDASDEQV